MIIFSGEFYQQGDESGAGDASGMAVEEEEATNAESGPSEEVSINVLHTYVRIVACWLFADDNFFGGILPTGRRIWCR